MACISIPVISHAGKGLPACMNGLNTLFALSVKAEQDNMQTLLPQETSD